MDVRALGVVAQIQTFGGVKTIDPAAKSLWRLERQTRALGRGRFELTVLPGCTNGNLVLEHDTWKIIDAPIEPHGWRSISKPARPANGFDFRFRMDQASVGAGRDGSAWRLSKNSASARSQCSRSRPHSWPSSSKSLRARRSISTCEDRLWTGIILAINHPAMLCSFIEAPMRGWFDTAERFHGERRREREECRRRAVPLSRPLTIGLR